MNFKESFKSLKTVNNLISEYENERTAESSQELVSSINKFCNDEESALIDPNHPDCVDLFVNFYKLLSNDESSTFIWPITEVLKKISSSEKGRLALTEKFKFVPLLSKFVTSFHTPEDKRLVLLQLLQELTYGIVIQWQEAYLPNLITSLAEWIMNGDSQLIHYSLGVLVNICYNNPPVLHTLLQCVEVKKFFNSVLLLQVDDGTIVQICKLLIILKSKVGELPESEILVYFKWTNSALAKALGTSNVYLIKQIVDFFKKIMEQHKTRDIFISHSNYKHDLENILRLVEEEVTESTDCLRHIFSYFNVVVNVNRPDLVDLYPRILSLALSKINKVKLSASCLSLVSSLAVHLYSSENEFNNNYRSDFQSSLETHLNELLSLFETNGHVFSNDQFVVLTNLICLFDKIILIPSMEHVVYSSLNKQVLKKLFLPLLDATYEVNNLFQSEVFTFYLQALCFLSKLVEKGGDADWLVLYVELVQQREVQKVIAIAIFLGDENVKIKALSLLSSTGLSLNSLASRMCDLKQLMIISPIGGVQEMPLPSAQVPFGDPMAASSNKKRMDYLLSQVEQTINDKEGDTPLSPLVELYQNKIQMLNQVMVSGQKAADERVAYLQHSLALANSELAKLHSLLHSLTQDLDNKTKEAHNLKTAIETIRCEAKETHNKYKQLVQNMKSKTIIVNEQSGKNKELQDLLSNLQKTAEENSVTKETLQNEVDKMKMAEIEYINEIESLKKRVDSLITSCEDKEKRLSAHRRNFQLISELATNKQDTR